ncbi:hypothetical protein ACRTDU_15065 [Sunxiuqinia elliptica]|uniref:Uncharacterized protein n=1 Tax=Sunxiuqinia elliptica TaxID=655355 RepID=A0A1I2BR51_9BACT|nr:hypothetical protein [Sunxiuqinia elliptica]SFE58507.1 hypothetical protein SAMN05216283_101488 [Sunxiuqinia elliptica]
MEKELVLNQARVQELGMEELKAVEGGMFDPISLWVQRQVAEFLTGFEAGWNDNKY